MQVVKRMFLGTSFALVCLCTFSAADISCGESKKSKMVGNEDSQSCQVERFEDGKTALLLGATGETGQQLIKQLVRSSQYSRIVSIGRREVEIPDDIPHQKVEQVIVDFDNLEQYSTKFSEIDVAFCCLGTTRAKAGADGFVRVDHDYVLKAAQILRDSHCPEFHLLTSKGSNANSWFLYPSTKGKVENAVIELDFPRLAIYRPGLLLCDRKEKRLMESAFQSVARMMDKSFWWSVETSMVAKAMIATSLKKESGKVEILEHNRIVELSQM